MSSPFAGQVSFIDMPLMAAASSTSVARISELSARVLASILWSLGTTGCPLPEPMLSAARARGVGDLGCQDVTNMVWTFGKLQVSESAFMDELAEAFLRKAKEFKVQELANLA